MKDRDDELSLAIEDLSHLRRMRGPGVTTPPYISEPIVCSLMRWRRMSPRSAHDAESPDGRRIQIKFSTVGYVSCKREDVEKWDCLAWVHAPGRLPKFLIEIPASVMRRAQFSGGGSLHIGGKNLNVLRDNVDELRAWRLDITDVGEIATRVRERRPSTMPPRLAIAKLEYDIGEMAARARRAVTPIAAPLEVEPPPRMPTPAVRSVQPALAQRTHDPRLPRVGTVIQKKDRHGNVRCECKVVAGGIAYRGSVYKTISGAAKAAAKDLGLAAQTADGFAFFGLK